MNARNPSSSSESYLDRIGLENYIHPTQSKTFASLRKQGLIDIENPAESKILAFIARTPTAGTTPVSAKVRQHELHAFILIVMRNWLTTGNVARTISSRRPR